MRLGGESRSGVFEWSGNGRWPRVMRGGRRLRQRPRAHIRQPSLHHPFPLFERNKTPADRQRRRPADRLHAQHGLDDGAAGARAPPQRVPAPAARGALRADVPAAVGPAVRVVRRQQVPLHEVRAAARAAALLCCVWSVCVFGVCAGCGAGCECWSGAPLGLPCFLPTLRKRRLILRNARRLSPLSSAATTSTTSTPSAAAGCCARRPRRRRAARRSATSCTRA